MHKFLKPTNIVALLILLVGVLRLIYGGDEDGRFGETTLLYFFGAASVFLLSRVKTFKFGDLEFELEQLKEEIKEAKLVANIAQDSVVLQSFGLPMALDSAKESVSKIPGPVQDDPWNGVFGGCSLNKKFGRILSADVVSLSSQPGWYSVTLTVTATQNAEPFTGFVQFFLHDSFLNDRPVVRVINGAAVMHLRAWGAFTVGALSDDDLCELELNLAQLESAPIEFRSR